MHTCRCCAPATAHAAASTLQGPGTQGLSFKCVVGRGGPKAKVAKLASALGAWVYAHGSTCLLSERACPWACPPVPVMS